MIGFTYFSSVIYSLLYFLNIFWFYKIVKGIIEFVMESGDEDKDKVNDEEEETCLLKSDE